MGNPTNSNKHLRYSRCWASNRSKPDVSLGWPSSFSSYLPQHFPNAEKSFNEFTLSWKHFRQTSFTCANLRIGDLVFVRFHRVQRRLKIIFSWPLRTRWSRLRWTRHLAEVASRKCKDSIRKTANKFQCSFKCNFFPTRRRARTAKEDDANCQNTCQAKPCDWNACGVFKFVQDRLHL